MTRTALLLMILSALLLVHYFPGLATAAWSLAFIGAAIWLITVARKYQKFYLQRRDRAALAREDEREYREYEAEVSTIRTTAAGSGSETEVQLALLQEKHRPMLERRFGPH